MEKEKLVKSLEEMIALVKAGKELEETVKSYLPIILSVIAFAEVKKILDKAQFKGE